MKKKFIYKIKDLPRDMNLVGCKLGPKYIISGWNKGFWLADSMTHENITPIFFKSFDDIKDWKVEVTASMDLMISLQKHKAESNG
jgi:hypothetical protein